MTMRSCTGSLTTAPTMPLATSDARNWPPPKCAASAMALVTTLIVSAVLSVLDAHLHGDPDFATVARRLSDGVAESVRVWRQGPSLRLTPIDDTLAFAALAGVRHLVTFHHDPAHSDDQLDRLTAAATAAAQPRFRVSPGTEGAWMLALWAPPRRCIWPRSLRRQGSPKRQGKRQLLGRHRRLTSRRRVARPGAHSRETSKSPSLDASSGRLTTGVLRGRAAAAWPEQALGQAMNSS